MKQMLFNVLLSVRKVMYVLLGSFDRALNRQNPFFILAYHSVADDDWRFSVDKKVIIKQLNYVRKHYDIISLKDAAAVISGRKQIQKPSVVLTFDDGYKDVLVLKEFFAKHNIRPALFVLSDTKNADWKQLATKRPFLNKKEILSLKKAGWEIGSHSATHGDLAEPENFKFQISNFKFSMKKKLENEIIGSKKKLESELGIAVPYFSYPRGKYNQKVLELVKKAKYALAVTMDDGFISSETNSLLVPRVGVDRTHSFAEFKAAFSPSVVGFRKLIKETVVGRYL